MLGAKVFGIVALEAGAFSSNTCFQYPPYSNSKCLLVIGKEETVSWLIILTYSGPMWSDEKQDLIEFRFGSISLSARPVKGCHS